MNGAGPAALAVVTPEQLERTLLVVTARKLERLMARRRKMLAAFADVDDQIRYCRKLIRDLTTVVGDDAFAPAPPAAECPDHRFGDRGLCFTCGVARE